MYKQQWLTVRGHVYTCTYFHGTIFLCENGPNGDVLRRMEAHGSSSLLNNHLNYYITFSIYKILQ